MTRSRAERREEMMETGFNLSEEIAIVACGGYPANEMAGRLNELIQEFGPGRFQEPAMSVIDSVTLVARVMETYPKEYMKPPIEEIPQQLRDWASGKRNRAAELKENVQDFERALSEVGLSPN
jgi:hypothetical protein